MISPSNLERVLACPGSVHLASQVGNTPSTNQAAEGTTAHRVAELYLLGKESEAREVEGATVEMFADAASYRDYINDITSGAVIRLVEARLLSAYMRSTHVVDFMAVKGGVMYIVDYKYGHTKKYAEGNPQLLSYALAALDLYGGMYGVETVELTIYQPRRDHISAWRYAASDVYAWAVDVLEPGIDAAAQPDAPLNPGDHCRYCPAAPRCKALAMPGVAAMKQTPDTMSLDEVAEAYTAAQNLATWLKTAEDVMRRYLLAGVEVPGYKLVQPNGMRRWVDPKGAMETLDSLGFAADTYSERKLGSIKSVSDLVPKDDFERLLEPYIDVSTPGPKIVPSSDKRTAIDIGSVNEQFLNALK